jgi:hypothetical protein
LDAGQHEPADFRSGHCGRGTGVEFFPTEPGTRLVRSRPHDDRGGGLRPTETRDETRVAELLALNRYPTNGTNNASPEIAAKAAMAMAATAPDAIKKAQHDFKDDGEDPTDSAKAPEPGRNTGFDDKFMHQYWHYIDKPLY